MRRVRTLWGGPCLAQHRVDWGDSAAQVDDNMDYVAALPHLRIVMMGKQWGSWAPRSLHFLTEFAAKLALRHGSTDVLRISFPGQAPASSEG